jgi:hypothetical protein
MKGSFANFFRICGQQTATSCSLRFAILLLASLGWHSYQTKRLEMIERPLALDYRSGFRASWTALRRAAEAMRTTQAAVSLKLKRLEEARLPARRAHASLCALDGARRELPLRAHVSRSQCSTRFQKADVP